MANLKHPPPMFNVYFLNEKFSVLSEQIYKYQLKTLELQQVDKYIYHQFIFRCFNYGISTLKNYLKNFLKSLKKNFSPKDEQRTKRIENNQIIKKKTHKFIWKEFSLNGPGDRDSITGQIILKTLK